MFPNINTFIFFFFVHYKSYQSLVHPSLALIPRFEVSCTWQTRLWYGRLRIGKYLQQVNMASTVLKLLMAPSFSPAVPHGATLSLHTLQMTPFVGHRRRLTVNHNASYASLTAHEHHTWVWRGPLAAQGTEDSVVVYTATGKAFRNL